MSKRARHAIAALVGLACLLVGLFLYGNWAIHQVQPFYATALKVDPVTLEHASLEMESRVAALVSDAAEKQTWHAAFSDVEVNGWLATALTQKFAGLLPETVTDLRIAFSDRTAALGFRYQDANYDSVFSIHFNAVINNTDVVAIRLLQAHAGKLPIPLTRIITQIATGAQQQNIALRWTQQEGDPVVLIPINDMLSDTTTERRLETIEFHEGELYVAGSTLSTEATVAEKEQATLDR